MFRRPPHLPRFKAVFVAVAIVLAAASLIVSHNLTAKLKQEEQNRMEIWAEAMRSLIRADENTDLSLVLKVINQNHTIPIVILDSQNNILDFRNIGDKDRDTQRMKKLADEMRRSGGIMQVTVTSGEPSSEEGVKGEQLYICYGESKLLRQLSIYPYIQLIAVTAFIAIAIYALLTAKRAEQNKIWVGLSRETAHQLGTPISSLMAWTEILRDNYPDDPLLPDLENDIRRLQLIAERFSKIGSEPELALNDLNTVITHAVAYMQRRAPDSVHFEVETPAAPIFADLNPALFEWVIENLCKNAIDAMSGKGLITIRQTAEEQHITVEVSDTGHGIPRKLQNDIFRPGFTTKKRGWGLGLSLARRIIEDYHKGRIFVKSSGPAGTTFAIVLRRSAAGQEAAGETSRPESPAL